MSNLWNYLEDKMIAINEKAVPIDVSIQPGTGIKFLVEYGNKNEKLAIDFAGDDQAYYIEQELTSKLRENILNLNKRGAKLGMTSAFIKNEDVHVFLINVLDTLIKKYASKLQPNEDNQRELSVDQGRLGDSPLLIDDETEFILSADNEEDKYIIGISDPRVAKSLRVMKLVDGIGVDVAVKGNVKNEG